jgi:ubiquinone/menaquinone biosynthesis C-methylase UbiE
MRAKIAAALPDVAVLEGTAEAIPLGQHEVDAVVVGEAFHWFRTAAATAEIARVLTARGGIALLWNTPTWRATSLPWLIDFRALVAHRKRAAGDYPADHATWRDDFQRTRFFSDLEHIQFAHTQTLDAAAFVDQVASWSWIANLHDDVMR